MSMHYYAVPTDKDALVSEQVHHQQQIQHAAIKFIQSSRRYARTLTKTNIKIPEIKANPNTVNKYPSNSIYISCNLCKQT